MTWTADDRRRYAPALMTVVRSGMIARLARAIEAIDPPAARGRPRLWSSLIMLQALWSMCRFGVPWRALPETFPPRQSVATRLARWRTRRVLDRALTLVVACLRVAGGRDPRPSAAAIDTQSVRTGPQRGPRGYDAGKKVKGRKRVMLVDVGGNPLGVRIVPADVQDRDAIAALEPDLAAHPSLLTIWLDHGFAAERCGELLERRGIVRELVGTKGRKGFVVEPRRWKIEQSFGCLQRYRRLRVDDEMSCESSRTMAVLASLFMTAMRLERVLRS
jgi:transposase